MEQIKNILNNSIRKEEKLCKYEWQQFALDLIEEFEVPKIKKASVFRTCKENLNGAKRAKAYCVEGSINSIDYFFKMISVFNKK